MGQFVSDHVVRECLRAFCQPRLQHDASAAVAAWARTSQPHRPPLTRYEIIEYVLTLRLPNHPGAVADLCEKLAAAHIPIGYMYCTGGAKGGKTTVVLKVPNIKKAVKVTEATKNTRRDMTVKLRRPTGARR